MLTSEQLSKTRSSLLSGRYNLLLGAGISYDSSGPAGEKLKGGRELENFLNELKGVKNRPLNKVYDLLERTEIDEHLTNAYSNCKPGPTVRKITKFIWSNVFTFNIDDALEAAYANEKITKQTPRTINYSFPYETPPSKLSLHIVHLHGWVRLPEHRYVFSLTDYAKVAQNLNPWMHVLSEILATEPFIISGTSLTESDLEYYLSHRSPNTARQDRGPSILVEPFPDAVTRKDCEKYGLILVESTLEDFLEWLLQKLGEPPTLEMLALPSIEGIFSEETKPNNKLSFFSAFELVQPASAASANQTSGFYYGQPATWQDLASMLDVTDRNILPVVERLKSFAAGKSMLQGLMLMGVAGAGKTTSIRRIAYNFMLDGGTIFQLKNNSFLEFEHVVTCLSGLQRPAVVVIDNLADNINIVRRLLEEESLRGKIFILSTERDYRKRHIESLNDEFQIEFLQLDSWQEINYVQLIEKFRSAGLLAYTEALHKPQETAEELEQNNEPVALAGCRLLNNYRPAENIISSVWADSDHDAKRSYLTAALAEHCHSTGIRYALLHKSIQNPQLHQQLNYVHSLPLCYSSDDDDYVLPLSAIVGQRVLLLASREAQKLLLDIFISLAKALSPHVNRRTIRDQTSEARIAGRLFQAQEVVQPLLGDLAEDFYIATQLEWQWNSRYWEHRALLVADKNLPLAIQHARHAVAIEQHPFPWTTLASLLLKAMDTTDKSRDQHFREAYGFLTKALDFDSARLRRHSQHAYLALFDGVCKFVALGGRLTDVERHDTISRITDAQKLFRRAEKMQISIVRVEETLSIKPGM